MDIKKNQIVESLINNSLCVCVFVYLQDEDEVVDRFASLVQEVLRRAFVTFVELELLDDVRVSEDPQQDFLCDLERAEQAYLWWGGHTRTSMQNILDNILQTSNTTSLITSGFKPCSLISTNPFTLLIYLLICILNPIRTDVMV